MGLITIGIDVGQKVDPTAICVSEHETRSVRTETPVPGWLPTGGPLTPSHMATTSTTEHFTVGHLERLPLRTSYPDVVRRVVAIEEGVFKRVGVYPRIYVDATGVGLPVVELLDRACKGKVVGCYFVHGTQRRIVDGDTGIGAGVSGGGVSLGKAWLVSRLQVLLQNGQLHLPNTHEARALAEELKVYEIRVDENANDKYGAFKTGTHDDLVTALGLSVQDTPSLGIFF